MYSPLAVIIINIFLYLLHLFLLYIQHFLNKLLLRQYYTHTKFICQHQYLLIVEISSFVSKRVNPKHKKGNIKKHRYTKEKARAKVRAFPLKDDSDLCVSSCFAHRQKQIPNQERM